MARTHAQDLTFPSVLPTLRAGAELDIESLREPGEGLFLGLIYAFNVAVLAIVAIATYLAPEVMVIVLVYGGMIAFAMWVSTKLAWAFIEGHGVRVGPNQYPQIYEVVRDAAAQLKVPMPTVIVFAGSGLIELLVAKRFSRRGYIIVTSNLMEALIEGGTSRELMMLVGRQLGHIKAGHFKHWFLKDVIGLFTWLIHRAYWRRCHLTADRVGLMVAGDYYAAEQSLLIITVGPKLASHTSIDEVERQADDLRDHFWPRVQRWLSDYPYIVERIARLREFASSVSALRDASGARPNIGALPIRHMRLRTLPVMMVHGHDHHAVLEVKDFLRARYPFVDPVMMALETLGGTTLPEKFERLAAEARGAIAILTPDDLGAARAAAAPNARARQNVVLEIGWFWGRLGRARCLLLSQGTLEIPSDLSGVDCLEYIRSPREHFHSLDDFIARLESLETGIPSSLGGMAMDDGRGVMPRAAAAAFAARDDEPVSIESRIGCRECGAGNPIDSRFCEQCGAPVAAAMSA
jgi:Zn-dependent protease with chaperone function